MSRFHIPRDKNLCRKKNSKGVSFAKIDIAMISCQAFRKVII